MKNEKLAFIDALRGLAALYVFFMHFSYLGMNMTPARAPDFGVSFIQYGWSGVSLFFMISAFTLCMSAESRRAEQRPVLNFYIRRFFRIAPLFYVWIILSCIRDHYVYKVSHGAGEISASIFFYLNFLPSWQGGFVWGSWTLGVEMIFYAIFPMIFSITRNLRSALVALASSVFLAWIWQKGVHDWIGPDEVSRTFAWRGLLYQIPFFMGGILVYRVYQSIQDVQFKGRRIAAIACVASWFIYIASLTSGKLPMIDSHTPYDTATVSSYTTLLAYGLLIIGLALSPLRLIVNRFTRFAGKISYSIYLSHAMIFFLLSPATAWFYAHLPGIGLPFFASAATSLTFIFAFSTVTHRLVEEPGNRLGRHLIERISVRMAVS